MDNKFEAHITLSAGVQDLLKDPWNLRSFPMVSGEIWSYFGAFFLLMENTFFHHKVVIH